MGFREGYIDDLFTHDEKLQALLKDEESLPWSMSQSLDDDVTMLKNSKRDIVIGNEKECLHLHSKDDSLVELMPEVSKLVVDEKALQEEAEAPSKQSCIVTLLSNLLFYLGIVIALLCLSVYSRNNNTDIEILGYHFYTVLTTSMQSEIPQGSFIFVENVDVNTIKIGDDITFYKDENVNVTHRVVGITEDYNGSGTRCFETWGVDNRLADEDSVSADNVVGVVKMHIPYLGSVFKLIANNVLFVLALFGVGIVLPGVLKTAKTDSDKDSRTAKRSGYSI